VNLCRLSSSRSYNRVLLAIKFSVIQSSTVMANYKETVKCSNRTYILSKFMFQYAFTNMLRKNCSEQNLKYIKYPLAQIVTRNFPVSCIGRLVYATRSPTFDDARQKMMTNIASTFMSHSCMLCLSCLIPQSGFPRCYSLLDNLHVKCSC